MSLRRVSLGDPVNLACASSGVLPRLRFEEFSNQLLKIGNAFRVGKSLDFLILYHRDPAARELSGNPSIGNRHGESFPTIGLGDTRYQ
jgi:hypothetical protein